jgi:hypothetical protein
MAPFDSEKAASREGNQQVLGDGMLSNTESCDDGILIEYDSYGIVID